ncbi:MAG: hypothetical protein J6I49_06475 [Bacteroidales bacterium]|nr:hypothetical protein [Bacteroidales bacterium]
MGSNKNKTLKRWQVKRLAYICLTVLLYLTLNSHAEAQAPGTIPVKVSYETQMLNGRRYYVHIVEKGQTVYSISRAYKVQAVDAVTHKDIHFLHPGDTVWLPARGQFATPTEEYENNRVAEQQSPITPPPSPTESRPVPGTRPLPSQQPSATNPPSTPPVSATIPPEVRKPGKTIRISLLMPLHLSQIDEISTSKFDVEQRGKRTYRQFEFIEFYEGLRLALDRLAEQGIGVDLNVVDLSQNNAEEVRTAFATRGVANADLIIALLLRDAFDQAATLARDSGVYIVNPMATRSEICAENPYMVKIQPSIESQVASMLNNMKAERPDGHLYIIHGGSNAEKPLMAELRRQLGDREDIKYTLFNWSQYAKLTSTLKATPNCNILSIYDHKSDQMRIYIGNLLNRLAAFKANPPTLYTFNDWTQEYSDLDFSQLQQLNYHTFYSSWDMSNAVHVDFLKQFRQQYGTEPTSPLAATAYDLTLYLVEGLHKRSSAFWIQPTASPQSLIHPIHLNRKQAGMENDNVQLYRMESLRFVPAPTK